MLLQFRTPEYFGLLTVTIAWFIHLLSGASAACAKRHFCGVPETTEWEKPWKGCMRMVTSHTQPGYLLPQFGELIAVELAISGAICLSVVPQKQCISELLVQTARSSLNGPVAPRHSTRADMVAEDSWGRNEAGSGLNYCRSKGDQAEKVKPFFYLALCDCHPPKHTHTHTL